MERNRRLCGTSQIWIFACISTFMTSNQLPNQLKFATIRENYVCPYMGSGHSIYNSDVETTSTNKKQKEGNKMYQASRTPIAVRELRSVLVHVLSTLPIMQRCTFKSTVSKYRDHGPHVCLCGAKIAIHL